MEDKQHLKKGVPSVKKDDKEKAGKNPPEPKDRRPEPTPAPPPPPNPPAGKEKR